MNHDAVELALAPEEIISSKWASSFISVSAVVRYFDRVKYSSRRVLAISIGRKTDRWANRRKEIRLKEARRVRTTQREKLRIPSKLDLSVVFRLKMSNHHTITLYIAMNYSSVWAQCLWRCARVFEFVRACAFFFQPHFLLFYSFISFLLLLLLLLP